MYHSDYEARREKEDGTCQGSQEARMGEAMRDFRSPFSLSRSRRGLLAAILLVSRRKRTCGRFYYVTDVLVPKRPNPRFCCSSISGFWSEAWLEAVSSSQARVPVFRRSCGTRDLSISCDRPVLHHSRHPVSELHYISGTSDFDPG